MEKVSVRSSSKDQAVRMPNIFMALSCADLRWNDLIANIFKLKRQTISEKNKYQYILNKSPMF